MRKLLIGLLVIVLLGVGLLGAGAYFLYRAAQPVVQNAREYVDRFSRLGELDKEVRNTAPYAAPANGELTREQVERFARVQERVRAALGERLDEIEAKYRHFKASADGSRQPTMSDVVGAFSELANVVVDARRAQVEALNDEGFSSAEYEWVRTRVYQAAGVQTGTNRLEQIAAIARKGTGIESIEAPKIPISVPEKNRVLVKPYLRRMDEWIPLAFFGL